MLKANSVGRPNAFTNVPYEVMKKTVHDFDLIGSVHSDGEDKEALVEDEEEDDY